MFAVLAATARRMIRVRCTVEKNKRYGYLQPEVEAPPFPDLHEAALRAAIARACKPLSRAGR